MKQTELKGIITPILTPMNADESMEPYLPTKNSPSKGGTKTI